MLLAETTQALPDPNSFSSIGWLALALFGLCGGVNQILKFTDRFKANPPLHKEYATKIEHDGLRSEFADFRDEVRVSFDDAAGTSRQSREKIYNELRQQATMLASNTKETELTRMQVSNLDRKIDRILERQAAHES